MRVVAAIVVLVGISRAVEGFTPRVETRSKNVGALNAEKKNFLESMGTGISNFFTELDNFMDDASARRLGNGAAFYGKRKSNFYGEKDKNRKENSGVPNPMEDYQAPSTGGYFQWMPDDEGNLRPVTRMKKRVVERNPKFWDKIYAGDKDGN